MVGRKTSLEPPIHWSDFSYSPDREQSLRKLIMPREKYSMYGYRTGKYNTEELLFKYESYCRRCNAFAMSPLGNQMYKDRLVCWHHSGHKIPMGRIQVWSCCETNTIAYLDVPHGCVSLPSHDWASNSSLPRSFWDLHLTPTFKPRQNRASGTARKAVSLDCEMATNRFDQPELIKLTLIDFFNQEVLIDSLVKPQAKVKNMLTSIHGITLKDIGVAFRTGAAINGRDAAREKIFEFVGPETMVFVHGGRNDFISLRWIHMNIVDVQEVENRVQRLGDKDLDHWLYEEGNGLEAMCRLITGIQIRYLTNIHDSLEDAMACRELGIWYAQNIKDHIIPDDDGQVESQRAKNEIHLTNSDSVQKPEFGTLVSPLGEVQGEAFWKCRVCQKEIPESLKLEHRLEKTHMERLILLVQQKGG